MKRNVLLSYLAGAFGVVSSFVLPGCTSPSGPDPVDNPPQLVYFTESPPTVPQGGSSKFKFKLTDDKSLDKLVMQYADGTSQAWNPRTTVYEDSTTHVENVPGQRSVKLTGTDSNGQIVTKTLDYTVQGNGPPVVNKTPLSGFEGSASAVALKSIVSDPENDPLTTQVTAASPGLDARVDGDSLRYKMTYPDANGTYSITLSVSDGHNSLVNATIPVVIAPMDKIAGRVHDILEGSYISTVNQSLVMPGPFAGYVKVDGVSANFNADGTFSFPSKFPSQAHMVEWFFHSLSKPTDSSFVARITLTKGDYAALDLGGHTNSGTGPAPSDPPLPLALLRDFYWEADLSDSRGPPQGSFCGTNLKEKAGLEKLYLSAKDFREGSDNLYALTSAMMDTIRTRADAGLHVFLAPDKRATWVYGSPSDTLPSRTYSDVGGTYTIPAANYTWLFQAQIGAGSFGDWVFNVNGEIESAIVTLNYDPSRYGPGGFDLSAVLQELLSKYASSTANVRNPSMSRRTCLHEFPDSRTAFLTGCDQKLLTFAVQYTPGAYLMNLLVLPSGN